MPQNSTRSGAPGGGSTSGMVRFAAAARSAGLGGTGEGVAEGLAEQLSAGNLTDTTAMQGVVEQHHVEIIPESNRHGRPRDQFTLWFAANANVVNFTLGVLAIEFGLNLATWCPPRCSPG